MAVRKAPSETEPSVCTLAASVARLTLASVTPGMPANDRSTRATHDAQVMPSIGSDHSLRSREPGESARLLFIRYLLCFEPHLRRMQEVSTLTSWEGQGVDESRSFDLFRPQLVIWCYFRYAFCTTSQRTRSEELWVQ